PRRADDISGERSARIGIHYRTRHAVRLAPGRSQCAEVAAENCLCGYECQRLRRRRALARSLIATEEEQSVAEDRTAHSSAELVTPQGVLRSCESISSIKITITDELEQAAVMLIRPGLGYHVH